MEIFKQQERRFVRSIAWGISFMFIIASAVAALWTEQWGQVISGWFTILTSPCPLVTDYFRTGTLASAFFNAGACGLACALLMSIPRAKITVSTWAGYFLVIAHCFYGLNFLNMWPSIFGFFICCKVFRYKFRENLSVAMFSTAFAPFMSELLFRYPFYINWHAKIGSFEFNAFALFCTLILGLLLGFAIPAMLPGAKLLHRGYNLYNGGLACGLLGMLIYGAMYRTLGVTPPRAAVLGRNPLYILHGESYMGFCNVFFLILFGTCFLIGYVMNGRTMDGYRELLKDSGYQTNFIRQYGPALTLINFAIYGVMMVAYFDIVILLTDGAGYTGATCGIVLAAMTFAASGQHPHNVWPIIAGYTLLSFLICGICSLSGRTIPWTLSTQSYMNGLAFATGLCPFSGKFNRRIGILAGFVGAVICTSTSAMHGGFVLYNGGLTAGITALLVLPLLDLYNRHNENLRKQRNG